MRIVIIDCNYLCHRARFTTGPLSYKGRLVGVIFGFLSQLFRIGQSMKPDVTVFCWDLPKSIRKERYTFYKERKDNQQFIDENLTATFAQFDQLRTELLPQLGFTNIFAQSGYEADDIIACIVKEYAHNFVVASVDDDLLQLLEHCVIFNLIKQRIITKKEFFEIYGIFPTQWADVKKIAGCPSDCVPGIVGVGPITAAKFLRGDLKKDSKKYASIMSVAGKKIQNRNDWLVRLPLPGTKVPKLNYTNSFNRDELVKLCDTLGFSHLRSNPTKLDEWKLYFGRKK